VADKVYAGDISPKQAWELLSKDPRAALVDVRTDAEFTFVGNPDLGSLGKRVLRVCWKVFPTMEINKEFTAQVGAGGLAKDAPVIFMCRSGARSRDAAIAMTAAGFKTCYNLATGFEGDKDATGHRGTVNGWKVDGLPWMQG
jgi:rhodanese-related sulfurtransferase